MRKTIAMAALLAAVLIAGCSKIQLCQDFLERYRADPEVIRSIDSEENWALDERIQFGQYLNRNGLTAKGSTCNRMALFPDDGAPAPRGESEDDGPSLRPALPGDPMKLPGTGLGISP